jgi:hypothetical protein
MSLVGSVVGGWEVGCDYRLISMWSCPFRSGRVFTTPAPVQDSVGPLRTPGR